MRCHFISTCLSKIKEKRNPNKLRSLEAHVSVSRSVGQEPRRSVAYGPTRLQARCRPGLGSHQRLDQGNTDRLSGSLWFRQNQFPCSCKILGSFLLQSQPEKRLCERDQHDSLYNVLQSRTDTRPHFSRGGGGGKA